MIPVKTAEAIENMRKGGRILSDALKALEENIREGVTTLRLDSIARRLIEDSGAKPSFLGMYGFPNTACISIDDEVIHGIPSASRRLEEGMLVSIDLGVYLYGYHTDAARTFIVGSTSPEKKQLAQVTERCFFEAVSRLKAGAFSGAVGEAVSSLAAKYGYGVVREYCGHGVGESLHEDPSLPNYKAGRGAELSGGMTLAIEPMINMGSGRIVLSDDGWTVRTRDGKPSAHYENTVLITETGAEILTL